LADGAVDLVTPSAVPHDPLTAILEVQFVVRPVFNPSQDQFHGPVPATGEAGNPGAHRLVVGSEVRN
jgi:hypothetical protein